MWIPWIGQPVSGIPAPQYTAAGASFPLLASLLGSVTAAAYSFNGDPNTGIYSPAADKLSVSAGGTERMRVTAAGVAINATIDPPAALYVDGDIQFTGAMYDVSDMRMKTNIVPLADSLTKLKSLDTFSFEMKNAAKGTGREYGVSAQQVQAVFPELVRSSGDDDMLTVSYTGLIAPLIDAVKELEREVALLKAEVNTLKAAK